MPIQLTENAESRCSRRFAFDEPSVQIAQTELSAICRAVGVLAPNDSVELHNLPLVISVKCKKRDDTGDVTNEVKGYNIARSLSLSELPPLRIASRRCMSSAWWATSQPSFLGFTPCLRHLAKMSFTFGPKLGSW